MVAAYREPDRAKAKAKMEKLITALSKRVPDALPELAKLGRTLTKRATDVLAFFDRPGTSNGPTEAINGRLEHLRGSALGFRNLTHYIARSLLEQEASDPTYTLKCDEPPNVSGTACSRFRRPSPATPAPGSSTSRIVRLRWDRRGRRCSSQCSARPCWIGRPDPCPPTTSRTRPAGSPSTATTRGTPSHPHARISLRTPATTPTTPAHEHRERLRLEGNGIATR